MTPKPITQLSVERQLGDGGLFQIRLELSTEGLPPEALVQLGAGDFAVSASVKMREDLTIAMQQQLINAARAILNEVEAGLMGGVGSRPGQKAVKA